MMRHAALYVAAFLMAASSLALAIENGVAEAASGPCYFTTTAGPVTGTSGCSVSGAGDYGTNDIFTGRSSSGAGQAMGAGLVYNKGSFINYIVNRYNGSNVHNKVGAAFIMQEMRGSRAWPNAAARDDWVERMQDPSVTFHTQSGRSLSTSSWFVPSKNNVFYDKYNTVRDVVIIKQNGREVAVIERNCGNLVAGTVVLEPPFSLSVDSWVVKDGNRVSETNRRVGQSITFNHLVRNDGPGGMGGTRLNAYPEWIGGTGTGADKSGRIQDCDDSNGLPAGATTGDRCDRTFTIPNGASANSRYCQRVVASPRSSSNGSAIGSARACVVVTPEWHVSGSSLVLSPAGKEGIAGDAYTFRHRAENDGPHHMNTAGRGFARIWVQENLNNSGWTNKGASRVDMVRAQGGTETITDSGTLPAGFTAGDKYCQRLLIRYGSAIGNENGNDYYTPRDCIDGRREFNLIPGTTVQPGGGTEAGAGVEVTPVVDNQGPSMSRDDTEWFLASMVVPAGDPVPGMSTGAGEPCAYYANDCQEEARGAGTFLYGNPSDIENETGSPYEPIDFTIPDTTTIGTKYCFALSVKPYSHSTTNWRYGEPVCVTVGVKPHLTVWGHDLKVGSSIDTSLSRIGGRSYGSWGEYGVLSNGPNNGMASGSGLVEGNSSANQESWSALTFANSTVAGLPQFGNYGGVTAYSVSQNGATVITGDHTINAPVTIAAGEKRIVRVTGTLYINGDGGMSYANGPYSSIGRIPRVIYIADDIVIGQDVTRIDPWLVANRIATCSAANDSGNYFVPPSSLSLEVDTCPKSLIFNGPVVANQLYPYRTTDSGDNTDTAGEIFNLRADVFLSSYAGGGIDNPVASTDLVTDVPPRF